MERHMRDSHSNKPKIYLKHEKVNDKYICHVCRKPYSHTRDLKKHLEKEHKLKFELYDEETGDILP